MWDRIKQDKLHILYAYALYVAVLVRRKCNFDFAFVLFDGQIVLIWAIQTQTRAIK